MTRHETIKAAIKSLDTADPKNWTDDGQPRLSALQRVTGFADLTRKQADEALREVLRDGAPITPVESAQNSVSQESAEAVTAEGEPIPSPDAKLPWEVHQRLIDDAQRKVDAARADLSHFEHLRRVARADVAKAVEAWVAGHPKLTNKDLIAAIAKRDQEKRERIKAGLEPHPGSRYRARSAIDAAARAQRGGDVNVSYGNSFRRLPPNQNGRKVPSDL